MALFSKKQSNLPRRRQASPQPDDRAGSASLEERYSFRRNRTITGSASSRIASTNETNAQLKSPRVQAHELTQKRRHIGAILFLVLASALVLYGLVSQFTAGVVVKAPDVSVKLDPSYEKVVQAYLSSQPIERLRFMINTDKLNTYVQSKAPEVETIRADGSAGFGKSAFVVTMRKPIAGWSINGRQQYVDGSGTAFERNYFTTPPVQIVDKSGVQVRAGQAVASNRFLSFVGRAVGLSKAQGYTVTQVIIPESTTRQVELRLAGVGYPVKLLIDREPSEQIEDMARAVRWLAAHNTTPEYLDVRVSGEAFYR
jgi:hypothetical protein